MLGRNDLLSVAWLAQGLRKRPSGRAHRHRRRGGGLQGFGTGAMVSRRLLLTNHHVLHDVDEAQRSGVEFGFQLDPVGQLQSGTFVRLDPAAFFVTDPALDFTLVAVGTPADGRPVFDPIPLLEEEGKVIIGESVSIIQHPQGEPKQLALRENELLDILENFVHYRTDAAPGSSGSPVFNDQWEMVALHHSRRAEARRAGTDLTRDGQLWTRDMGEHRVDWLANEGHASAHCQAHAVAAARRRAGSIAGRALRLAGVPPAGRSR